MSEAAREILSENTPVPENTPELPMRWHGFLAKFYLWLAAAYHLFQSAWIFTGRIYIEPAAKDAIYASMPGMRILDWSFSALLALSAILQIISAITLIQKRKSGMKLLKSAYILLILSYIAYLAARLLISGMPPLNLALIGQAVSCIILLRINTSYYRNRL